MRMEWKSYTFGIMLSLSITLIAIFLSPYIPLGTVAIAIVLGIIIGNVTNLTKTLKKGITLCEKNILSLAVALMGVNLNFQILKELGGKSFLLIITALIITLGTSILLSKIFNFDKKFALLLGIGNGVCGSSAIAATEQIIGADEEAVGLSVAIVNFLGTIGIFLLPFISTKILHFSDINSGILSGNTLQAVGQVVAAGFSISDSAGQIATLIKMTRILMLFPLVVLLMFIFSTAKNRETKPNSTNDNIKKPKIPLFIIGFILFSLVPTFNLIPAEQIKIIGKISHYFLIIAMAGIGLKITLQSILQNGKFALAIGGIIFLVQILFNSIIIIIFFNNNI